VRSHSVFLGTALTLSLVFSGMRGLLDLGNRLPASQEFVASAVYGVLVTFASWAGYALVLCSFRKSRLVTGQSSLAVPSSLSAAVPVLLVYSGWLPGVLHPLRGQLGVRIPRLLMPLGALPLVCAASTLLVFWASLAGARFRSRHREGG